MNTQKDLRHSNPYRVPDGYFSGLRDTLRERAAAETEARLALPPSWWQRIKGLAGLSAAFGSLVLLATVGYYFTGYRAQQRERLVRQEESAEALLGYHVYAEDLEELGEYVSDDPAAQAQERVLFAEAVTEYLDTYGYGFADLPSALDEAETDW